MNARLAIAALIALPLAACTTNTQSLGTVVFGVPQAPKVADAVTVTPERGPQLHYTACLELSIDNPACPRSPDRCDEQPVETSEAGCERLAVP